MLNRCIQIDPEDARFYLELGKLQVNNPMWQKRAEENLKRSIELDATKVEAYLLLGQLFLKSERLESAATNFASALSIDPENEEALEAVRRIQRLEKQSGGIISKISGLFS